MNFAKYNNTYPYPSKADFTTTYYYKEGKLVATSTVKAFEHHIPEINLKDCIKEQVTDHLNHRLEFTKYQTFRRNLEEQFKVDLADELGLTGHPKFDKLFDIAWEEEHDCGYEAVYNYASTLAELLY